MKTNSKHSANFYFKCLTTLGLALWSSLITFDLCMMMTEASCTSAAVAMASTPMLTTGATALSTTLMVSPLLFPLGFIFLCVAVASLAALALTAAATSVTYVRPYEPRRHYFFVDGGSSCYSHHPHDHRHHHHHHNPHEIIVRV